MQLTSFIKDLLASFTTIEKFESLWGLKDGKESKLNYNNSKIELNSIIMALYKTNKESINNELFSIIENYDYFNKIFLKNRPRDDYDTLLRFVLLLVRAFDLDLHKKCYDYILKEYPPKYFSLKMKDHFKYRNSSVFFDFSPNKEYNSLVLSKLISTNRKLRTPLRDSGAFFATLLVCVSVETAHHSCPEPGYVDIFYKNNLSEKKYVESCLLQVTDRFQFHNEGLRLLPHLHKLYPLTVEPILKKFEDGLIKSTSFSSVNNKSFIGYFDKMEQILQDKIAMIIIKNKQLDRIPEENRTPSFIRATNKFLNLE